MGNFYLVQRGEFTKNNEAAVYLTGCKGVVELPSMDSSEYEFGALPKSFRRIMWDYSNYKIYPTGIKTLYGEELKVFCRKDRAEDTIWEIKEFVRSPWPLKVHTGLEMVAYSVKVKNAFWWGIDLPKGGKVSDWMAFLSPHEETFKKAIHNDYTDWWCNMYECERREEFEYSLL